MTGAGLLVLFDIDGTLLLRAAGAHRDALHAALREVHGIADPAAPRVHPAGRTDGEIARAIALGCGVSAERIDARADAVREACCREYARRVPDSLADHVAPGMDALLDHLAGRDGLRLSLVTGNYEPVARLKLARAGLAEHFEPGQGGFGSDSEDRAALPEIARRRAGTDGRPWPRERTVVVGDTPNDIACARADGVRVFAVATGPFAPDELTAADAVAADAAELRDLLDAALSDGTVRT